MEDQNTTKEVKKKHKKMIIDEEEWTRWGGEGGGEDDETTTIKNISVPLLSVVDSSQSGGLLLFRHQQPVHLPLAIVWVHTCE